MAIVWHTKPASAGNLQSVLSPVVRSTLYHVRVSKLSKVMAGAGFLCRMALVIGDIIKSTFFIIWYEIENKRNHTAVMNVEVLYLYWKPADREYGNHNHNHTSHTLLAPATFS